jgi:hypothetical protein
MSRSANEAGVFAFPWTAMTKEGESLWTRPERAVRDLEAW